MSINQSVFVPGLGYGIIEAIEGRSVPYLLIHFEKMGVRRQFPEYEVEPAGEVIKCSLFC